MSSRCGFTYHLSGQIGNMKTPLYDEHLRLGAKMTEFAGWELPVYYSGIIREVAAVHSAAGVFDLSHMGELYISGSQAVETLQRLTTNDVTALDRGKAQYNLICNDNGGIIDDLILYRLDPDCFLLVVNAINTKSDFEWIRNHNAGRAKLDDASDETALIAVQGPISEDILMPIIDFDVRKLSRFGIICGRVGDIQGWIARTGYTGEDGFEIYCSVEDCKALWRLLLEVGEPKGMIPCGLGTRDVLRIEAGYPLYGHELNTEITPVHARLLWVVKFSKDFIGKEAILETINKGPGSLLVGLKSDERCVPRQGYDITFNEKIIGRITSGTFSPTIGKGIAMGYVGTQYTTENIQVCAQIRGKSCPCNIQKMPFYTSKHIKQKEEIELAS